MKLRAILCSGCGRPCLSSCVARVKRAVRFQVGLSHAHQQTQSKIRDFSKSRAFAYCYSIFDSLCEACKQMLKLALSRHHVSRQLVRTCVRNLSHSAPAVTRRLDPSIRGFVDKLSAKQPCFNVPTKNIQIYQQPSEFYQCLLVGTIVGHERHPHNCLLTGHDCTRRETDFSFVSIHRVKRRRTGESSRTGSHYEGVDRVRCKVDALYASLRNKPHLQIRLLLDFNRSTRPGPDSTARILLPLLRDFPDRIEVSLFRSPKLKGLMAKLVPPRFNEGWGTWHPKIYGIDEEVMLSGCVSTDIRASLILTRFQGKSQRILFLQPTRQVYSL